jgi:hypothetical protein
VSIDALKYLKDSRIAPNGEPIMLREKAILWYLANAHSEEKRCAWPSIRTIALANNVSERTVQEILKECVRKGIVWRRETKRENGSLSTNEWRFNVLDGDPTTQDLIVEEQRRIRGELMASRANARKRGEDEISTEACGSQREFSHQAGAEDCTTLPQDSAPPTAETCATLPQDSAPPTAETCTTLPQNPALPEVSIELSGNDSQNPQGSKVETSGEVPRAAAVENDTAYHQVWLMMLAELAQAGALDEGEYLRMCVETTQLRAGFEGDVLILTVGFSGGSASLLEFYASHAEDFAQAARRMGLNPLKMRLRFEPLEKAGHA